MLLAPARPPADFPSGSGIIPSSPGRSEEMRRCSVHRLRLGLWACPLASRCRGESTRAQAATVGLGDLERMSGRTVTYPASPYSRHATGRNRGRGGDAAMLHGSRCRSSGKRRTPMPDGYRRHAEEGERRMERAAPKRLTDRAPPRRGRTSSPVSQVRGGPPSRIAPAPCRLAPFAAPGNRRRGPGEAPGVMNAEGRKW